MSSIQYLKKGRDLNLCDLSTDFYKIDGAAPDLSSNTATMKLVSTTSAALPLTMTFNLFDSGVLNIKWTYTDQKSAKKVPFEVPASIINVDRTKLKQAGKLSDVLSISGGVQGPVVIDVLDAGKSVYTLNGFLLDQYFNYIAGTAHVSTQTMGLLGLFEQVSNDLFL
jgi:hypothetical protein